MSFSRLRVVLAAALLLASCSRREPPGIQRLAVVRFENLTPAAAGDWLGRGLAEVITSSLAGSSTISAIPSARLHALDTAFGVRPISAPGISAEAPLAHAAGANRIGYGEYAVVNGRLRVRLTIEDSQTRRPAGDPIEVETAANDPVGAATAVANAIAKDLQPYGTRNPAALEAYVRALEDPDPASIRRHAEQAVAADPNFGHAYILIVESAVKLQDRAGAAAALQAASSHAAAMTPVARLRLEILSTTLNGDGAGVSRAVSELTKATPLDPAAWKALADTATSRRDYRQATAAFTRALAIEPDDGAGWNQLGYVAAFSGNLDAAVEALRRYQALRPGEANPLDSLGDVNLLHGRFKEAETHYLEAHKKNPAFLNGAELLKAAFAHLLTGDVAGASAILGDRAAGADWMWMTGRRKEAVEKLTADIAKITQPDGQTRALSQLAVWTALLNDRAAAARFANQITSATPQTAVGAALARFVTQPSAPPGEWAARGERLFPNAATNAIKEVALAYALLLDRHFTEAIPLLRRIEARAGSAGDRGPAILLAWSLIETGKLDEAAPLLQLNPVPGADNTSAFMGLYFPRLFQLRALVAERQGKADEARENRRIYSALGGV